MLAVPLVAYTPYAVASFWAPAMQATPPMWIATITPLTAKVTRLLQQPLPWGKKKDWSWARW